MNYKGFISYKLGADNALTERLEIALGKFAKPTFKRRSIEIFRDGINPSVADDLGEKISSRLALQYIPKKNDLHYASHF